VRAYFSIPSFIVTLALFSALRGAAMLMTDAIPIPILDENFANWGNGGVLGIPAPALILLVVFAVFSTLATRTTFGRSVYAIGGNAEAAHLSGIPVETTRMAIFALTGGLAAISGLLMTSRLGSGNSNIGFGVEFAVITSVIVGGASLSGGKGTMFGTLLGGLFIAVLNNAMVLWGINSYAQDGPTASWCCWPSSSGCRSQARPASALSGGNDPERSEPNLDACARCSRTERLSHSREEDMKRMKTKTIGLLGGALFAGTVMAAPATDPVDQGEVFNIATFKVKPGEEAAFEQIMKQVVIDSRAEPGNLEYRFQQSVDNPDVYVSYEVFRTAAAAKAHLSSDHIQKVLPAVLGGGVDVKSYKIVR
jgi:quinol monooxygenase YgiN/drug/metabolite transporter superfamily protein YnfA